MQKMVAKLFTPKRHNEIKRSVDIVHLVSVTPPSTFVRPIATLSVYSLLNTYC